MRKLLSVMALGVVFVGISLTGSFALADLPVWSPKADLAQKLGPETALPRFTLQLPTGYKLVETVKKSPSPDQFRFAEVRDDGAKSAAKAATARLLVIPDASGTGWSPDNTLKAVASRRTASLKNVKKSAPEHGTIAGLPAVRMYIKGNDKVAGHAAEAHMFIYVIGEKELTTVVAYDTAPGNKASLPLLEAAAMTLHPIAGPQAEAPAPAAPPQTPVFIPDSTPAPVPPAEAPVAQPEPPVQTSPAPMPPVATPPQVNPGAAQQRPGRNFPGRPGQGGQQQPPGNQQPPGDQRQNPTAPMQPPPLVPVQPPPGAGLPQ